MMTIAEAINSIKYRIATASEIVGKGEDGNAFEDLDMAIKALEKQIPKKVAHQGCYDKDGVLHMWTGINGVPYDLCPNCEINLCTDGRFGRDKSKMKYCENCGQKLDWE